MTFTLPAPAGFSLRAAADFAREFPGTRIGNDHTDAMSFAWTLDGDWRTASVVLRQLDNEISGEIDGPDTGGFTAKVRRDVERILCLDIDATDFPALGRHDPVVEALQKRFAGLRPVLFYTPYEAAAWCIIGQRIQMTQAATIKQRLADDYGDRGAFPPPARLGELSSPQRGLTDKKIDQLHHLASAALDGALDRDRLRTQSYDDAEQQLQQLPGIGPFSAELILIRGVGAPDALPRHEKRLIAATRQAYQLPANADIDPVADHWRPYRSWIALLLRAAQ
jgi:DNA-3-methyladenine glycosylase II